jgi:hypothetical protein
MAQQIIRADGKRAAGVVFRVGGEGNLTPIEALARLIDPAYWRFWGMLAESVWGRLGKVSVTIATGERGAASIAWLSLFGAEEHVATRLNAQEAFTKPENPWGLDGIAPPRSWAAEA